MTPPSTPRLLAVLGLATAAIAIAACGDQDDDTKASGDRATAASKTTPAKPATDEGQIKAVAARVQKAFATGDGQVICDSLTPRGQRDIVTYGRATGLTRGDCTDVATGIVKRDIADGTKQPPTRIVTVRVRGNTATALIRIADTTTMQQRYQNQDGEWKIGTFNLASAVGSGTDTGAKP